MERDDPKSRIKELFGETRSAKPASDQSSGPIILGSNNTVVYGNFTQKTTTPCTLRVVVQVNPDEDHISPAQKAALKQRVNEIVETETKLKQKPTRHATVWRALNLHCNVITYAEIASEDYVRARIYLDQWLGRLNSARSAPVKNGDAWRLRKYRYIHVNARDSDDRQALDRYLDNKFGVTSLSELDSNQLETAYRYVVGRKSRRRS
ncbi:hypothetical protein ETW23_07830 [Leisingera sp. NJS201]|uniref:hypothetical protein n=1 Tax=Leisingera sp. NJS201 TaxID=2508306 RepID=UPI001070A7DA|nr:hypothetical protein [Leisingera sp. NJS201]QBR36063.1 hypothetical protein ETW23_07830 [Leisingera sp. NJS201]